MAKAIVKVFSLVDATVSAELDWAADAGEGSTLSRQGFVDSLFGTRTFMAACEYWVDRGRGPSSSAPAVRNRMSASGSER